MYTPSHALSSVNQVEQAYAANPQALEQRTQSKDGMTPQLIDMLALQRIKEKKDAEMRQMALNGAQAQPNVATMLEQQVMQSEREAVAKNMGLPALMSQVAQSQGGAPQGGPPQAGPQPGPQGAPQGAPPQGPPQGMARGGLTHLPTNLPSSYANGGIIAFSEGKEVPSKEEVDAAYQKWMDAKGGVLDNLLPTPRTPSADLAEAEANYQRLMQAYQTKPNRQPGGPIPVSEGEAAVKPEPKEDAPRLGDTKDPGPNRMAQMKLDGDRGDKESAMAFKLFAERYPDTAIMAMNLLKGDHTSEAVSTAPSGSSAGASSSAGAAGPMRPTGLRSAIEGSLIDTVTESKEDAERRAKAEYAAANKGGLEAIMASNKSAKEKKLAIQERERANRPSDLMTLLMRMGQNTGKRGLGGAFEGTAEAVYAGRGAQIEKDSSYIDAIKALDDAMATALSQNDIGEYKAALEARKELEASKRSAHQAGASIIDADTRAEATKFGREQADEQRAAQLEETRIRNAETAIKAQTESRQKAIEKIDGQLAMYPPENALYKKLDAQRKKLQAEIDAIRTHQYQTRGLAGPETLAKSAAPAAGSGKVFSYNTGKPI